VIRASAEPASTGNCDKNTKEEWGYELKNLEMSLNTTLLYTTNAPDIVRSI